MLKLDRISKAYHNGSGTVPVLQDVCLEVGAGEMCAIIGASGSGKSTLLNIMGLLDAPDSGAVLYRGKPVHDADLKTRANLRNRHIGFVFQAFNLLPRMSALDNVGLPLLYRGIGKSERRRRAQRWLERVGLADRAEHLPDSLSGGQKQRVAIARALVGAPQLVLADEPTGNLDQKAAQDILSLLGELSRESGVAVVIVTHDPAISVKCQREIVVSHGRVVVRESAPWRG
ncbi:MULTISPECIES: ABC transporter ATP-binding protein [Achromobacter]|jgi:putative ABC transport system ATP-binding protein|uniref:ABC transporter ATP-binding protein n=1 Tax=Achromobacter TaxID=222 RepID=UPI000D4E171D|nr:MULTISPECIES: ABC transporter ATP-binding protein [Achromobacter]MBD9433157.1 ABC transporter ATP-binding protein [Achromobacter sp. ACM03]MBD9474232.1 ABC transporter ATP-binding protein [Achromobacter sp. ACM01]MDQ1762844.1 ABC transporter ATP-binding protein [Achromobacter aegrifaciens]PTN49402.1 ABC transporter ATP-binding protein [Achromobacter xylosoxidans]